MSAKIYKKAGLIILLFKWFLFAKSFWELHIGKKWSNGPQKYICQILHLYFQPLLLQICVQLILTDSQSDFEKKKSVYRILIVGTSDDMFSLDGTASHIHRINEMFANNKYPVRVINCSTDGENLTLRNTELIRNELVSYDPDLILQRDTCRHKLGPYW